MRTLSLVIPFYNEEKRIHKTISALSAGFSHNGLVLEHIIFVDDGSHDTSIRKIEAAKSNIEKTLNTRISIFSLDKNMGKGYAVGVGVLHSRSDYTLFFDADISTPLSELSKFIPFIEANTPVIIGTRKNGKSTVVREQPFYRRLLGKGFTFISNKILGTQVTDFTCGFKAFSKEAKDTIFPLAKVNRWAYDAEIIYLAIKLGYTPQEVPVSWTNDEQSKVRVLQDIVISLRDLFAIRMYDFNGNYVLTPNIETIKGTTSNT